MFAVTGLPCLASRTSFEVEPIRLEDMDKPTAVAEDDSEEAWAPPFDVFEGENCPGQHWACYRFGGKKVEQPWNKELNGRPIDPVDV